MSGAKLPDKISGFVVNEQKIRWKMVFILYKSSEVFQGRVELLFWKVFRVFWLVFLLLRHSSILESKLGLIQKVFQFVQEWVFESWSIQKQKLKCTLLRMVFELLTWIFASWTISYGSKEGIFWDKFKFSNFYPSSIFVSWSKNVLKIQWGKFENFDP